MDDYFADLRLAVRAGIQGLSVPTYDSRAIVERRHHNEAMPTRPSLAPSRRLLFVALAAIVLAIPIGALATSSVSVLLREALASVGLSLPKHFDVSRSIEMSLDDVRKRAPFPVVVPHVLPSGVRFVRSEYSKAGTASTVYLHFTTTVPRRSASGASIGINPDMLVLESGRHFAPTNLGYVMVSGLDDGNAHRPTIEKIHPDIWRVGNTWITVMSPGALPPTQIDQIRRAMGARIVERAGKTETIAPKRDRP